MTEMNLVSELGLFLPRALLVPGEPAFTMLLLVLVLARFTLQEGTFPPY